MKKIVLSLISPVLVLITRPLGLTLSQSIVLASLIFAITNWTTMAIKSIYTSLILLIMFSLFGNTPLNKVFSFFISSNFLLITFSFVFSQGIANSKLPEKLLYPLIDKYVRNVYQLLITVLLSAFILTFVIPQPLSRVILLSFLFNEYLDKIGVKGEIKEVLMFSIMAFGTLLQSLMKRSDLLLSTSAISLADVYMSEGEWMKYMTIPGLLLLLTGVLLFILVYRKELRQFDSRLLSKSDHEIKLSKDDKINLFLIGIVVLFWATEEVHHISGAIVVVAGTIIMYLRKMVDKKDIKTVNISLLFFLAAVMSIGVVMKGSGIGNIVFGSFSTLFPRNFSSLYIFLIVITSMSLHMILGSNLTSMSIVIPGILTITSGIVDTKVLMLLIFVSLFPHYILPVHSTVLAMGVGYGYFTSKTVSRFGIFTTPLVILSIYLYFIPWWRFIGVL